MLRVSKFDVSEGKLSRSPKKALDNVFDSPKEKEIGGFVGAKGGYVYFYWIRNCIELIMSLIFLKALSLSSFAFIPMK